MRESIIANLENMTLDHQLRIRRAARDGVIMPEELRDLEAHAAEMHQAARESHRTQRAAISVLRTGRIATQVYREFGGEAA
jgi:hypothetical protein